MDEDLNLWKKEFRESKDWKEKREKFIVEKGRKCEWCGSTEFLTPAHKDCCIPLKIQFNDKEFNTNFIILNSALKTNYYMIFNDYLREIIIKDLPKEYFKKDKNSENGTSSSKLKKDAWKNLYQNEEIRRILNPVVEKTNNIFKEWYSNFDNCLLLCRRCHYAQSKGQFLCGCKKSYYFIEHGSCPNCYPKEKKEKITKRKKEEEEFIKEQEKFEREIDEREKRMFEKLEAMEKQNKRIKRI
ncbi:hypothetical protein HYT25_03035 [Candidatus Pacearchaeota archaeon]|nr:hypothetical protein [Candidatus Pacearchaeota archaeon]